MRILLEILIFFAIAAIFGWDNYLLIIILLFVIINFVVRKRK